MRSGYGPRARRSGVTRGKDTAWYREAMARDVEPPADTDMKVRWAERQVEQLRKGCIGNLARDQRLSGQQRRTDNAFRSWESRLKWHLETHHGQVFPRNEYGTSTMPDGSYLGPWKLDDLHEELHGRA